MLYRFECPTPEAHHGYGHNWEACFHPIKPDLVAAAEKIAWLNRNVTTETPNLVAAWMVVEAAYPDA